MRILRTLLLAGLVALAACGGNGEHDGMVDGPDIPVQDPDLVAAGDPLYQENCAVCHGSDLRGTSAGPSHLSIVYAPDHHTDLAFTNAVKFGVQPHHWNFGPMAPVPGLSDPDIEAIIAFVRENQRLHGFEAYPPE